MDPSSPKNATDHYLIIAVEESDSSIGFYDSESHRSVARIEVGRWPHEIDLSADRSRAYVTNFGVKDYDEKIGTPGASISVIDVENKCEVDRLYTFGSLDATGASDTYRTADEYRRFRAPHGIKLSPDGQQLFVNVETEDMMLVYDIAEPHCRAPSSQWRLNSSTNLESLPDELIALPEGTHNFIFSDDGYSLLVVSGLGGVTEYDLATRKPVRGFRCNKATRGLSYSHDRRLLIASASDELCLIHPDTFLPERTFRDLNVRQLLYSQPTPDGLYVLSPAVWEGQLLRIDLNSGEVKRIMVGIDPIHVLIGPDYATKKLAYVSHGRSRFISVIDCEQFHEIARIPTRGGPNGIAWAPYSPAPTRKKLVFGACLPLSGPSIVEGQDLRLGYQLWQEKVNAGGGLLIGESVYEIDIIYADTRSRTGNESDEPQPPELHWSMRNPPEKNTIEKLTEDLIERGKAQFLLGTYPSPPNLHCGRVANDRGLPFITASGAAGNIYSNDFRTVFGIMTAAKGFLNESFSLLSQLDEPPESVVFLSCEDPAAMEDAKTTIAFVRDSLRMRVIPPPPAFRIATSPDVWSYKHQNTDFNHYIAAAQKARPDVLAITGHLPESIAAVYSAVRVNFVPKAVLFSVGPAFPQFIEVLGTHAQHMTGAAMWTSVQQSYGHDRFQTPEAFANEFTARYSRNPAYLAAGAVACGFTFEEAFRRAGITDAAAVVETLRDPSFRFESFYSRIEFDQTGLNSKRPLVTIQLRLDEGEMKHVLLWPKQLASGAQMIWPFPGW
jgi:hypothetical protein